ncbi:hypothetical protein MIMGU_mgv11b024653mg [Erythranthe guttata]|uniref:Uncharacterized protein n=1 Tax=Erythranthe guttata TaxID=4155 RepID=A0A022R953_ERYGU|nr:hypothetical protein MIMGU_mgv11b024653mg [Erythranthe guttata]
MGEKASYHCRSLLSCETMAESPLSLFSLKRLIRFLQSCKTMGEFPSQSNSKGTWPKFTTQLGQLNIFCFFLKQIFCILYEISLV